MDRVSGGAGVGISQEEAQGHGLGRRRGTEAVVGKVGLQASCAPCRARPHLPEGRCESRARTEEDVPGSDAQRGGGGWPLTKGRILYDPPSSAISGGDIPSNSSMALQKILQHHK